MIIISSISDHRNDDDGCDVDGCVDDNDDDVFYWYDVDCDDDDDDDDTMIQWCCDNDLDFNEWYRIFLYAKM